MSLSTDGSESVDQFLARVASLSRRNDEEVAERNRKMEEEMMLARKQRRARREERARSLSPAKTGPAATTTAAAAATATPVTRTRRTTLSKPADSSPTPAAATALSSSPVLSSSTPRLASIKPPVLLAPRPHSPGFGLVQPSIRPERGQTPVASENVESQAVQASRPLPPPPLEKPTTPTFPPSTTTLSRSGTLSWQQRPLSRDGGTIRSRPLSPARGVFREPPGKAVEKQTQAAKPEGQEEDKGDNQSEPQPESEPSRADIAASLAARDPSWFRQTADRGTRSAAYRKSKEDSAITQSSSPKGTRLPGMVAQPLNEDIAAGRPSSVRAQSASPAPSSPSLAVSVAASGPSTRVHAPSLSSANTPLSTNPASSSERESSPGTAAASLSRTATITSSPARPASPTKGLGGFVQSAMMKRSDSVSKRWSVQANGLKRSDSVASNRPAFNNTPTATPLLGQSRVLGRDPRPATDGSSSPVTGSRPTSASAADVLPDPFKEARATPDGDAPAVVPKQSSAAEAKQERPETPSAEVVLDRSPSKTMDPRRWSPTKASWLESALAKPESPRPSPTKAETPAWKVGLERSRSQRRPDSSPARPTNFDSVAPTGLLRQTPLASPTKTPESVDKRPAPTPAAQTSVNTEIRSSTAAAAAAAAAENPPKQPEAALGQTSSKSTVEQPASVPAPPPDRSVERIQDKADEETKVAAEPTTLTKGLALASHGAGQDGTDNKRPALKPKPQTPPKIDFRSTLRSRQADDSAATPKDSQLEFKAVFGKLKPTQTQNYVAPDIFKQNITQGKAALSVTGGPQKTKRVDELKESILSRKEEMKAGGGSILSRANVKDSPQSKEPEVPEALARRNTLLHKTKPSIGTGSAGPKVEPPKVTASKPAGLVATAQKLGAATKATTVTIERTDRQPLSATDGTRGLPLGPEGRREAVDLPVKKSVPSDAVAQPLVGKTSILPPSSRAAPTGNSSSGGGGGGGEVLAKTTSNKLAARLNPTLAGLIARGNGPRTGNEAQSTDAASQAIAVQTKPTPSEKPAPADGSSGLTHMTKARARGPKRRAPKAESTSTASTSTKAAETPKFNPPVTTNTELLSSTPKPAGSSLSSSPSSTLPKPAAVASTTPSTRVSGHGAVAREKPRVASKSSELRKVSEKARLAIHQSPLVHSEEQNAKPLGPIPTPTRSPEKSMPLTPSKTRLNTPKLPDSGAGLPVLLKSATATTTTTTTTTTTPRPGLGLGIRTDAKALPVSSELTPPLAKEEKVVSSSSSSLPSDIETALLRTFGVLPRVSERQEFDTEAFLKAQQQQASQAPRIKTISNTIVKVSGDGKQAAMPASQEHVLYEDSMYLCVHKFETDASTSTEVYLWAGDGVPEAAVEDAQIFCRKVARDNDTKLQVLNQGMEPAAFLSALGGILIIRKSTSSDLYMLCGRRHGGHIVFDQVDLSPSSLCSGFSYLISAKAGKLYLWIGTGSCADEYGAARLVGTDLGLSGEIEEVAEGREPAAFWTVFSSPTAKQQYQPSKAWALRAGTGHSGYPCKLYRIDPGRPKSSGGGFWGLRSSSPPKSGNKVSLQEIEPFSQRDLKGDSVYLLDTYAAIYVMTGRASASKSADFVSALHVAQELAVLTPSMQDRALLPACHVAFGEPPPRDCQAAFRKWRADETAGSSGPSALFDMADVMRVLA